MLKLHDELIEELAKSLMEQNYNPVVVTNHRLYARRFLDYLAERGMPVTMDALFTLVKEGNAPRAEPRQPVSRIRAKRGIRPCAKATSR